MGFYEDEDQVDSQFRERRIDGTDEKVRRAGVVPPDDPEFFTDDRQDRRQ